MKVSAFVLGFFIMMGLSIAAFAEDNKMTSDNREPQAAGQEAPVAPEAFTQAYQDEINANQQAADSDKVQDRARQQRLLDNYSKIR